MLSKGTVGQPWKGENAELFRGWRGEFQRIDEKLDMLLSLASQWPLTKGDKMLAPSSMEHDEFTKLQCEDSRCGQCRYPNLLQSPTRSEDDAAFVSNSHMPFTQSQTISQRNGPSAAHLAMQSIGDSGTDSKTAGIGPSASPPATPSYGTSGSNCLVPQIHDEDSEIFAAVATPKQVVAQKLQSSQSSSPSEIQVVFESESQTGPPSECSRRRTTRITKDLSKMVRKGSSLKASRSSARWIVQSAYFEHMMGFIICLNCVSIGVGTQLSLDEQESDMSDAINLAESVFLLIYMVELALRLMVDGWHALRDAWVSFDALLVILGCVDYLSDTLKQVMLLRLLRIMRLLRALRMVQQFKPLWKLVYGLMSSVNGMLSMLVLLCVVFFVFGCLGLDLITKDPKLRNEPELNMLIEDSLSSLPLFMLTLLRFATADGVNDIYFHLIVAKPALIFYFVPLILVVSIALMNLITASIVEGALASAATDKALQQQEQAHKVKRLSPMIRQVFKQIDNDGSGNITIQEMFEYDMDLLPEAFLEYVEPESMIELFEMLDVDGSNEVGEEEFVVGVLQLCLADVPVEIMQILKLVRLQHEHFEEYMKRLEKFQAPTPCFTSGRLDDFVI